MRLGIQNRWGAAPCEKPDGLPSGFFTRFSHRFAPVRAGLQRGKTTRTRTRALGAWVQGTGPGPGAGRMGARERAGTGRTGAREQAGTGRTGAREQAGTGRWAHGCKGAGRGRALGAWVQGHGRGNAGAGAREPPARRNVMCGDAGTRKCRSMGI